MWPSVCSLSVSSQGIPERSHHPLRRGGRGVTRRAKEGRKRARFVAPRVTESSPRAFGGPLPFRLRWQSLAVERGEGPGVGEADVGHRKRALRGRQRYRKRTVGLSGDVVQEPLFVSGPIATGMNERQELGVIDRRRTDRERLQRDARSSCVRRSW